MKKYLLIALPLLLTLTVSYFLQYKIITNQEGFTNWLSQFGPFVIIVYVLLQTLTIIIAPIGGFFLVVAMIALFGPGFALSLSYFVTSFSYLINFFLAKRFGRPLVKKLIGMEALYKIDHLVKDAGLPLLIITRVFQGANFDYLSYGWGLTKIPVRQFIIVNFLGGILSSLVIYFLMIRSDNLIYSVGVFYIVTIIFSIIAFTIVKFLKR